MTKNSQEGPKASPYNGEQYVYRKVVVMQTFLAGLNFCVIASWKLGFVEPGAFQLYRNTS
jgi:hypothetical protein